MRHTHYGFALAFLLIGCGGETQPTSGGQGGIGTGGTSLAGATGKGGSSAAGGGSSDCVPACAESRRCCAGQCVNLANDPRHCGNCGHECTGDTYCGGGQCVTPPCSVACGSGATCCDAQCCAAGQLCCDPQGPLDRGPICTTPNDQGTCPQGCAPLCICASPDTPIATPQGNRPIASLRVGDLVYSIDRGAMRAVPILRTNRTPVSGHHVLRVTLSGGSSLEISAGHPTSDGRSFRDLRAGGFLDGVPITAIEEIAYQHDATYDILPDSDTGTYFAGGVLIGSTLASGAVQVVTPSAPCEPTPVSRVPAWTCGA